MKRHIFYLLILIILTYACKKEVNSPESNSIETISRVSNGCIPKYKPDNLYKISDTSNIEIRFDAGNLKVNLNFTTHCSAEMADSINLSMKSIEIFLADTNEFVSRCLCTHKEEFIFELNSEKEIRFIFYYKLFNESEYKEMADTTIIFF
jgi:hypothetical protein